MPDYAADGTMVPGAGEPGEPKSSGAAHEPLVRCPSCGADVVPREGSYGVNEPSVGRVCTNCGASLGEAPEP